MNDVDMYPVLQTVELHNTWLFFLYRQLVIYVYYNDIGGLAVNVGDIKGLKRHQTYWVTY